jgi:hypothetical protein
MNYLINVKQWVKMAPSLLFLDEDLGSFHFLFTIFNFFLNYMLGCFQNQSSLFFRQVCIVSYWSCKFLKLCQKNVLFVPDLLRFLTHCFTLINVADFNVSVGTVGWYVLGSNLFSFFLASWKGCMRIVLSREWRVFLLSGKLKRWG